MQWGKLRTIIVHNRINILLTAGLNNGNNPNIRENV
ncbi:Uncharacterised protein [Serratia plymuthica]|nr:hypothetical protein SOD10_48200 [Serratia plymuthica]CAI0726300.1 Uncharacterised protein [Serratia plymuthica]